MATLTIRDIDEDTKTRLRVRAARHGRSMEAATRNIIDFTHTGIAVVNPWT